MAAATSASMRELMRLGVTHAAGTGRRAEAEGYGVGGKTGTAEMPGRGGYREKAVISSFLGAFPMDAPRYVTLVMLFEPQATGETRRAHHSRGQCRPGDRHASSSASLRSSACCRASWRRMHRTPPRRRRLTPRTRRNKNQPRGPAVESPCKGADRAAMNLSTLVGPETTAPSGCDGIAIAGLTADSREVRPGWLFAALRGVQGGRRPLHRRCRRQGRGGDPGRGRRSARACRRACRCWSSAEPRRALALMAARFYGAQPGTVVAVTGTSGKTSVADFTRQIFAALGHKAASLGTIGLVKPDGAVYGSLTSPDPVTLHRTLAELAGEGVTHLALRGLLARPRPAPARRRRA